MVVGFARVLEEAEIAVEHEEVTAAILRRVNEAETALESRLC